MTARRLFMLVFSYVMQALGNIFYFMSIKSPRETTSTQIELCTRCPNSIFYTPYSPRFYDNGVTRAFYTPSKSDVRTIENDLLAPSAELAALEAEITRIQSLLQILEDRHTRLNIPITRTRQFLDASPIRRLPSEVLCIIFWHYCHTPVPEDPMRYELPFTLAVVCSQWRSILLDTPSLWTIIQLGPRKSSPALVDRQLDLSGNLPLSLRIQGPLDRRPSAGNHDVYEETDEYFKDVLRRVFHALPRWKDICLQIKLQELDDFDVLLQGALQPVNPQGQNDDDHRNQITPDLLETVVLKVPHIISSPTRLPKIFESAPSFKSFCFFNDDNYPLSGDFWPSQGLPWKQLDYIMLEHTDLHVLDRLPPEFLSDGQEAELELNLRHLPTYRLNEGIVISKFTSLSLAPNYWTSNLARYLEALSIPNLKHVEVGCAMCPGQLWRETPDGQNNIGCQNILTALLVTITRSKCMIKSFTFYVFWDAPDKAFDDSFARAIIALLYVMPELETLEICEAEERGPSLLSDPEFFSLCGAPETGGLLPKLESLELVWAADCQPSADLVTMLQSKIGGSALKSVVIGVRKGGDLPSQVLDCLRRLREYGIQATLW
ncbi:hypothetical protein CPB85DRAFT_1458602 [Mucidula mucida]|nr:hypothetical protein CPB85DRAFT_1458602 [Mucidula mucida]